MTGLKWFKIYQDGLDSSGKWGVDRLIANKGKMSFSIPSCIAAGQYLLRVELIGMLGYLINELDLTTFIQIRSTPLRWILSRRSALCEDFCNVAFPSR